MIPTKLDTTHHTHIYPVFDVRHKSYHTINFCYNIIIAQYVIFVNIKNHLAQEVSNSVVVTCQRVIPTPRRREMSLRTLRAQIYSASGEPIVYSPLKEAGDGISHVRVLPGTLAWARRSYSLGFLYPAPDARLRGPTDPQLGFRYGCRIICALLFSGSVSTCA